MKKTIRSRRKIVALFLLADFILFVACSNPAFGYAVSAARPLKLNGGHYELAWDGVQVEKAVKVMLPQRSLRVLSRDLAIKGRGFVLAAERFYDGLPRADGPLGDGWGLSLSERLIRPGENQSRAAREQIVLQTGGAQRAFNRTGKDSFQDSAGSLLQSLDDQIYKLKDQGGVTSTFAADGRILSKEDRNGNGLRYTYEGSRLISLEESSQRKILFTYDAAGRLTQISDDLGRKVSYSYSGDGLLSGVNYFGARNVSYGYNKARRLAMLDNPEGNRLTITYDSRDNEAVARIHSHPDRWVSFSSLLGPSILISDHAGQALAYNYSAGRGQLIITIKSKEGWQTEYTLAERGQLIKWAQPRGNNIHYQYDELGRLTNIMESAGGRLSYSYAGDSSRPVEISDAHGLTTQCRYDRKGNLVALTLPGLETVSYDLNQSGLMTGESQGRSICWTADFDDAGNRQYFVPGSEAKHIFSYDPVGRLKEEKIDGWAQYAYDYNEFDQLIRLLKNGREEARLAYDAQGRLITYIGSDEKKIHYDYDDAGRLISARTPAGLSVTVNRPDNGSVIKYVFPDRSSKSYRYNYACNLIEQTDAGGEKTIYDWSPQQLLTKETDADGNVITYSYDSYGRLVEKNMAKGHSIHFRYQNEKLAALSSPFAQLFLTYGRGHGKLETVENRTLGVKLSYHYNGLGQVESVKAGAQTIQYQYDQNQRLSALRDSDRNATRFSYDRWGNLTEIVFPNGIRQEFTFRPGIDAPSAIRVQSPQGNLLFHEKYAYRPDGFVESVHDEVGGTTKQYHYDDDDRIVQYIQKKGDALLEDSSYEYDRKANLRQEKTGDKKVSYTYTGIARLTRRNEDAFTCDKRGNLTSAKLNTGAWEFSYNAENRLTAARLPDGSRKDYGYDPLGRIVYVKHNRSVRHIVWDGPHPILELDQNKALLKTYLYADTQDFLIGLRTDRPYYVHLDRLGSVRLVTDAQGQVVSRLDYDPFGKPLLSEEPPIEALFFAGRPYDKELGCYDMRRRFYSPELKRFLSQDPFAGTPINPATLNPYIYALNNPQNLKDPNGEFAPLVLLGAAIVYGGAALISFGAGYLVGTAINKGVEFVKDPDGHMKAAADKVKNAAETVGGANVASAKEQDVDHILDNSPGSIEKTPEGFENVQKGVQNAQQLIDAGTKTAYGPVMAPLANNAAHVTNPDPKAYDKDHAKDVSDLIEGGTKKLEEKTLTAGAEALNVPGGKTLHGAVAKAVTAGAKAPPAAIPPAPPPDIPITPYVPAPAPVAPPKVSTNNVPSEEDLTIPPELTDEDLAPPPGSKGQKPATTAPPSEEDLTIPPELTDEDLAPPPGSKGQKPAAPGGEKPDDDKEGSGLIKEIMDELNIKEPGFPPLPGATNAAIGAQTLEELTGTPGSQDSAGDFATIKGGTALSEAANEGANTLDQAQNILNQGGQQAQTIGNEAAIQAAGQQANGSWGDTLAGALEQTVQAGAGGFGAGIGGAIAPGGIVATGGIGTAAGGSTTSGPSKPPAGSAAGKPPSTPTPQTQTSGSFTASLVPSGNSYYITVQGKADHDLVATVSGTDGYANSFKGKGSIKSSVIPAGASGINDTVVAKDINTGETATFNFKF